MFFERTNRLANPTNNRLLLAFAVAAICAAGSGGLSQAGTAKLSPLHVFCANGNCADGEAPDGSLVADVAGNLYGTAANGGSFSWGTAFELTPNSAGNKWAEHVLYSFCAQGGSACSDGKSPHAGLLLDHSGNLYGTTVSGGGQYGSGTVFELPAAPSGKKRQEKVLYQFCTISPCTDGQTPSGPLIMAASGNLYGTTQAGGVNHAGVVFELAFDAAKKRWKETPIYSFCPAIGCADGSNPAGGVIMDKSGNLYGVTTSGGNTCNPGCGVVYELTFNTSTKQWSERVIHNFVSADGTNPAGTLIMDEAGNLYGTAKGGGSNCQAPGGVSCGSVFELSFNKAAKSWQLDLIHTFCTKSGCADGLTPDSGLIMDSAGDLYGTTPDGGAYTQNQCAVYDTGCGVVFEFLPGAKPKTWNEKVLHTFCENSGCADGTSPVASLILPCPNDNGVYQCQGTLYGATSGGGASAYCYGQGCGVAFALKP